MSEVKDEIVEDVAEVIVEDTEVEATVETPEAPLTEARTVSAIQASMTGMSKEGLDAIFEAAKKAEAKAKVEDDEEEEDDEGDEDEGDVEEGKELNEMGPEYLAGAKDLVEMFPFLNMTTASLVIGALGVAGLTAFSAITAKVMDMALAGRFGEKAKSFAIDLQKAGGAAAKARNVSEGEEEQLSFISKARAKSSLRQFLSGKRDDGMGKFDAIVYGIYSDGKKHQIKYYNYQYK